VTILLCFITSFVEASLNSLFTIGDLILGIAFARTFRLIPVTKACVCSPFTGGGITLPWGIAVDGNDTVWVFNFGAVKVGTSTTTPTGISRYCGVDTKKCPPGMRVGDPISPDTGYRSDSLQRITGGQIDPSGNVWLTNNWKIDSDGFVNPGGNAVVIAIGAAAPVKTPLIGPPVSFK